MKFRCIWLFIAVSNLFSASFITYDFSSGRFGDNLLSYLHAKWLSYQNQTELLYKPFPYSSDLCLDEKELHYSSCYVQDVETLCYVCPYFSECSWDIQHHPENFLFRVDWKDKEFRKIASEMIAPKNELSLVLPPKDTINIAIHVREGGGFDTDHTRLYDPLKLPPLDFYIDGLLKILKIFNNRSVYCYVFTDAKHPETIVAKFKKSLKGQPHQSVVFDYRKTDNRHDANVMEDFFSLFSFDILIRSQSNFSLIPSLLQDYDMVCYPLTFKRKKKQISITNSFYEVNEHLYRELLNKN